MARIVVALGGNAILRKGERGTVEEQWRNVRFAASALASAIEPQDQVVVTHGNGPQVGQLAEMSQLLMDRYPPQSMDIYVAMTQGWLGYMIAHGIEEALGHRRRAVVVITRTLVRADDPDFQNPSKFVGSYFSDEVAGELSRRYGWTFKRDPRGGMRRVVPSPEPLDVLEAEAIEDLLERGYIVVAVGGGGVPVVKRDGSLAPVEAVVDKDLATAVLATRLRADKLVILTDVPGVAVDYGKPTETWLRVVKASQLAALYDKGLFPPGSMGPKVLAAIRFVRATGGHAVIGDLEDAANVIRERSGTVVVPG